MIKGNVDGLEGSFVFGWAIDLTHNNSCRIEILNLENEVIARGLASRKRKDLEKLGFSRSDFAFRVPLPDMLVEREIRILADGVELWNSPLQLTERKYDSSFYVKNGRVVGWVKERIFTNRVPEVSLVNQGGKEQGAVLIRLVSDPLDKLYRAFKFDIELSQVFFGACETKLSLVVDNVNLATVSTTLALIGNIEHFSLSGFIGWLFSPDAPRRKLVIELIYDGNVIATGETNIERLDVQSVNPSAYRAGFNLIPKFKDALLSRCVLVSLRLKDSSVDLLGGPFLIGNRAGWISAARRLASSNNFSRFMQAQDRALLQGALLSFISERREEITDFGLASHGICLEETLQTRMCIVIPVYRGIAETKDCITSVVQSCSVNDRIIVVNDCSPEPGMAEMLSAFREYPNILMLHNSTNIGFIGSINRAFALCDEGDVLLLNSDTRVFEGGLDEMWRILQCSDNIGTVTAISNNATIFSYPDIHRRSEGISDISWSQIAAVALQANKGNYAEVPTAHGFCMLIRRALVSRLQQFNPIFGRGYGEENEFCQRASDLGYIHVAAGGAFVEHKESVSFGSDKSALIEQNLQILSGLYPEYHSLVVDAESEDLLRKVRWPLDEYRLVRTADEGKSFVLVVENWLGGGSVKAARMIEKVLGVDHDNKLTLRCRQDGYVELFCRSPLLRAVFASDESQAFHKIIRSVNLSQVLVHQLLGFGVDFLRAIGVLIASRPSLVYIHDFYPVCPRVTLIDAVSSFCGIANARICDQCVSLGGSHEASRLNKLTTEAHRELFRETLSRADAVITPSFDTNDRIASVFPNLNLRTVLHPEQNVTYPRSVRPGDPRNIIIIGAIGSHKGSRELATLARYCLIYSQELQFHVVGYTDIDSELGKLCNVSIYGAYNPRDLPGLLDRIDGRLALFLHGWPETFSYTLSEVAQNGLFPLVPDIGAPAERVRSCGFGEVFGFPVETENVLSIILKYCSLDFREALDTSDPSLLATSELMTFELKNVWGSILKT